jgi:hypothetical protein
LIEEDRGERFEVGGWREKPNPQAKCSSNEMTLEHKFGKEE